MIRKEVKLRLWKTPLIFRKRSFVLKSEFHQEENIYCLMTTPLKLKHILQERSMRAQIKYGNIHTWKYDLNIKTGEIIVPKRLGLLPCSITA